MVFFAMRQFGFKDAVTLGNAVAGLAAIMASFNIYFHFPLAVVFFIFLAALFDYLDGVVARKKGASNELGKELDSLADAVSFAVAPVVFVLATNTSFFAPICAVAFMCAGLMRLSLYNIQEEKHVYFGLPIPFAAMAVAVVQYAAPVLSPIALLVCAVLMLSRFKLSKPSLKAV